MWKKGEPTVQTEIVDRLIKHKKIPSEDKDACVAILSEMTSLQDDNDYVDAQGYKGSLDRVHKMHAVRCHRCEHPLVVKGDTKFTWNASYYANEDCCGASACYGVDGCLLGVKPCKYKARRRERKAQAHREKAKKRKVTPDKLL
jgi:hypothetical protein